MKLFIDFKKWLFSLLILVSVVPLTAQNAVVKGTVKDSKTLETLVGTTVMIEGTTKGTITDFEGNFVLGKLSAGSFHLVISFVSYNTRTIPVTLSENQTLELDIELEPATLDIGEVQVVARANRESEVLLLLDQKNATGITESIGSGRLSDMGVSDAATATSKITGVTKSESSGGIYVRGLGDRYLSTTFNGLPIPSDDVSRKNIDLNLFSTDIIRNIGIDKTYSAKNYGDQASGAINISSKGFTETFTFDATGKVNSNVLKEDVWNHFKATQNIEDLNFGLYQRPHSTLEAITGQSWNTRIRDLPFGFGLSVAGGKSFKLFGNELTVFATAAHENEYDYQTGVYRKYRSNILDNEFTDAENFSAGINTTGLANVAYEFNNDHRLEYNALAVLKTTDEVYEAGRNRQGYVFDQDPQEEGAFVRDQNLKVTQITINQLVGRHQLGEKNLLNWAAGYNKVNADEPNRIRNEVNILDENSVQFAHVGDFQQRKSRQGIKDSEISGYIRDEFSLLTGSEKMLKLNIGASFRMKNRDFESLFMGVRAKGVQVNSVDNLDEALLNQNLFTGNELIIRERMPDTYHASLLVYAGYLDVDFTRGKLSGNAGARFGQDVIDVDWDVANYVGRTGSASSSYGNLLPGVNLKYRTGAESSLRLAMSKTITLPEFKELSPFEYVSPEGRVIKGNPGLKMSENYNLDLKWEIFPSAGELFSMTTFFKQINDPINLTQARGSSGNFVFENTGEQASIYGLEAEARVDLIKSGGTGSAGLNFIVNATRMWFKQDLLANFQYNNKTETGLQGASDFIGNAILSFSDHKENEFAATVTANYSSDKILALGAPEDFENSATIFNSAIIEKGFTTLDVVLSKKLSHRFAVKLTGKNLMNPEIKQTQHIEPLSGSPFNATVSAYRKGMELSLGIKINLN